MAYKDDPYDFSDAFVEEDPYDFSEAFSLPDPEVVDSGNPIARMLRDSGMLSNEDLDPMLLPKRTFASEPASSTSVGGIGVESPPVTTDKSGGSDNPLQRFVSKFNEMAMGRLGPNMPATGVVAGASAVAAAASTIGEMVVDPALDIAAMKDLGVGELEDDQSWAESLYEIPINSARSYVGLQAGLLHLPEALLRDPEGTVKAFITFVPHQASLVFKAVMPADTKEEKEERKAAWQELYRDPLGPIYAALIGGAVLKVGGSAAKAAVNARNAYKLKGETLTANKMAEEAIKKQKFSDEAGAAFKAKADLPPGVAGLLPDYSKQAVPVPDKRGARFSVTEEGVGMKPGEGGKRVPPAPGMNVGMEAVAGPEGVGATLGLNIPETKRSTGIPPPGNLMTEMARQKAQAKTGATATAQPTMTTKMGAIESIGAADTNRLKVGDPQGFVNSIKKINEDGYKPSAEAVGQMKGIKDLPPQYQPFLKSGEFVKSPKLDARNGDIMGSAHPSSPSPKLPTTPDDVIAAIAERSRQQSWFRRVFSDVDSRVTTAAAKNGIKLLDDVLRQRDKWWGTMFDDARKAGARSQARGPVGAILRAVKGETKLELPQFMAKYRDLWIQLGNYAKDQGLMIRLPNGKDVPFVHSEKFLADGPWRMELGLAKAIWDDLGGAYQMATKIAEGSGRTGDIKFMVEQMKKWDDAAQLKGRSRPLTKAEKEAVKDAKKLGKPHSKTKTAIDDMLAANIPGIRTRHDAMHYLAERAGEDLFMRTGVERPRLSEKLPDSFREKDPARLLGRYIHEMAQSLAEVEVLGPQRGLLKEMLQKVERVSGSEAALMKDLSDVVMGVIDREKPISYSAKKMQRAYAQTVYGLKIGLGFAPFIQITQPLISVIPDANIARYIEGSIRAMSPEYRAVLRRHGVTGINGWNKFMGMTGDTWLNAVPTIAVFNFFNKALDYTFAATGEVFARDLHRIANKGGVRSEWAKTTLKEKFGIDHTKPIEASDFIHMTRDYAAKMQLHPNATIEPMWMNMPQTRWLSYLKRFVYKQTKLSYDTMLGEARKGNVMPIIRAAIGGQLGGEAATWGKDRLQEFVTGQKVFREDDPMWQRFIRNYAVIGTMGWVSDMARIDAEDPAEILSDIYKNIEFGLMPVALSDARGISEAALKLAGNVGKATTGSISTREKMTPEEVVRRFGEDAADVLGTYGYFSSRRLRSDATAWEKNQASYTKQLKAARRAYWNDDEETAENIMWEWNGAAEQYPVKGDFGDEAVREMTWDEISNEKIREDFER